ncbi:LOW QUALITY PROTEIN: activin receptor type-2A [Atheta coriaria]|uniref:LOW QUALITY PROTEIN: activin receptor type-2A n=1 Tax=Dalotia coriaria TaxID=877792 RepID=UPI0031F390CE
MRSVMKMRSTCGFFVCIAAVCFATVSAVMPSNLGGVDSQIVCAKHKSHSANFNDDLGGAAEDDGSGFERCESENSHCYTFWTEDAINGTIHILGQGCWVSSGDSHDCQSQCIADKKPTKAMNNTMFCCCRGNMCNNNFSYVPAKEIPSPSPPTEALPRHSVTLYFWGFVSLAALSIILVTLILWRLRPVKSDIEMGDTQISPPPQFNLNKLNLIKTIGQGRYGDVWHGTIEDQDVAVKVFRPHHRNYFLNEHELYKEAGDNMALVKCFGGGELPNTPNGTPQYGLILSMERECLQEYLKKHTLDLSTHARMALGVAKGLAHLHSDIGKACIAHRDLNTRNILVRADLSCCICDLGLAVIPRKTENRSLSEAGTLRYMAPEVLEGAVNLRDCESALKQIDVYSLGLILWELGTRCTDMQNAEPAPYAQPFEKEIGERPTLEQMQTLVSRHKARPLWPASWKDTAPARFLAETAEDCWDQDAEARLTSLCVVERLLELPNLKGRFLHPMHQPSSPTPLINNNHLHDNIDASIGTIETLLSPTEEYCKNSNELATCITPLQPYQGRNPCMERNLLTGSSDSLLIDKSSKHCTSSESQNLISNDYLNYHQINHRAMPIPYVQNCVRECNVIMPKHNNVEVTPASSKSSAKGRWSGLKKIFKTGRIVRKDTQVTIAPDKLVNGRHQQAVTTILNEKQRPSTLPLLPSRHDNVNMKTSGISQLLIHDDDAFSRQRSLEQFSEVFSSTSDLSRLKNPSERVKTPGDVPPSVRRTRGKAAKDSSARFSLYDDRMMVCQWGSAPDLEPPFVPLRPPQLKDVQDTGSVSSF